MTNTERGLSRRSFLSAATAVAAAGALAGGMVMASAPMAGAATGSDLTWRIPDGWPSTADDNPNERAKNEYAALLRGIRQATSSHEIRPEGGRTVYVTDANGSTQYTTVDLHATGGTQFIRVYLRRSDAYVMGWRSGTEANGSVTWGRYFPLEDVAEPGRPFALPGATDSNTDTRYRGLATYTALSQNGANRLSMVITPPSLSAAVMTLHPGTATRSTAARSILQIIVALAEGTRFRRQAADTVTAWGNGQQFTVTQTHMDHHNNWSLMSAALIGAVILATAALSPELEIGGIVYATAAQLAAGMMLVHHSDKNSGGKKLEGTTGLVARDGTGDYWTVQAAIDAAPDYGANNIFIDKGVYHEVLSVPKNKSWLTIQGVTGNRADVVIYNTRCNGMINPATGLKYGTQGSAVATFRPPNLTVKDLTVSNTFDRAAHPEISPYETQAVAIAAMGDRQTYANVAIMSHQDTLLVKGETPTTEARQWFINCFIRGDVDFIFGNATAVIDRSTIQCLPWPNGTILAPNTDYRKDYGILLSSCTISTSGVPNGTRHLGRPWANTAEAWPMAVVRECEIQAGISAAQPWVNMLPGEDWKVDARFVEYHNFGTGTGTGENSPQLQDWEASRWTAQRFLAGTDGWNPLGI